MAPRYAIFTSINSVNELREFTRSLYEISTINSLFETRIRRHFPLKIRFGILSPIVKDRIRNASLTSAEIEPIVHAVSKSHGFRLIRDGCGHGNISFVSRENLRPRFCANEAFTARRSSAITYDRW